MSKVTSKLQVTVPKAIADQYGIRPGDDIDWVAAGDAIRIVPATNDRGALGLDERLRLFDAATARQAKRQKGRTAAAPPIDRGWTREELYARGRSR